MTIIEVSLRSSVSNCSLRLLNLRGEHGNRLTVEKTDVTISGDFGTMSLIYLILSTFKEIALLLSKIQVRLMDSAIESGTI